MKFCQLLLFDTNIMSVLLFAKATGSKTMNCRFLLNCFSSHIIEEEKQEYQDIFIKIVPWL